MAIFITSSLHPVRPWPLLNLSLGDCRWFNKHISQQCDVHSGARVGGRRERPARPACTGLGKTAEIRESLHHSLLHPIEGLKSAAGKAQGRGPPLQPPTGERWVSQMSSVLTPEQEALR